MVSIGSVREQELRREWEQNFSVYPSVYSFDFWTMQTYDPFSKIENMISYIALCLGLAYLAISWERYVWLWIESNILWTA